MAAFTYVNRYISVSCRFLVQWQVFGLSLATPYGALRCECMRSVVDNQCETFRLRQKQSRTLEIS